MCRNIKTLFNFEPPATELEIRDASLQFVRKLSGFTVPSKANEAAFEQRRRRGRRGGAHLDRRARDERRAARPRGRGGTCQGRAAARFPPRAAERAESP
jgi:hypothetical protein